MIFKNVFSNGTKLAIAGLSVVAALLMANASRAGMKGTNSVVNINAATRTATGSLGLARNSANTVEYIGCSSDSNGSVTCSARNAAGTTVQCVTSNSSMREMLHSLDGDSFVSFTWDTSGGCTRIYVDNYSFWPQKAP
jgi:hypothetical protein